MRVVEPEVEAEADAVVDPEVDADADRSRRTRGRRGSRCESSNQLVADAVDSNDDEPG